MCIRIKPLHLVIVMILSVGLIAWNEKSGNVPVQQLRIYKVHKGNAGPFHNRFRDHAQRIMKKYDFRIIGMWESKSNDLTEFIYMLEWKNEDEMRDQWKKFMADKEWQDIKKATAAQFGVFVDSIEDRVLIPTDYSPAKRFILK
ncbi:MAG TPA: NIPSNAP family protein [Chitinophagaceae bacterium]